MDKEPIAVRIAKALKSLINETEVFVATTGCMNAQTLAIMCHTLDTGVYILRHGYVSANDDVTLLNASGNKVPSISSNQLKDGVEEMLTSARSLISNNLNEAQYSLNLMDQIGITVSELDETGVNLSKKLEILQFSFKEEDLTSLED